MVLLNQPEECDDVVLLNGGEKFEELLDAIAIVQIVDQGLCGNTGTPEDEGATKHRFRGGDRAMVHR